MIDSFTGEYRWLSNFWPVVIRLDDGYLYPSVEHAYQASKTLSMAGRATIRRCVYPEQAKKAGKGLEIRDDWEQIKLRVMGDLLRQKFAHKELRDKLLATGEETLIEGNTWGDTFWGVCGVGKNHLGKLLMEIRNEIKEDAAASD